MASWRTIAVTHRLPHPSKVRWCQWCWLPGCNYEIMDSLPSVGAWEQTIMTDTTGSQSDRSPAGLALSVGLADLRRSGNPWVWQTSRRSGILHESGVPHVAQVLSVSLEDLHGFCTLHESGRPPWVLHSPWVWHTLRVWHLLVLHSHVSDTSTNLARLCSIDTIQDNRRRYVRFVKKAWNYASQIIGKNHADTRRRRKNYINVSTRVCTQGVREKNPKYCHCFLMIMSVW